MSYVKPIALAFTTASILFAINAGFTPLLLSLLTSYCTISEISKYFRERGTHSGRSDLIATSIVAGVTIILFALIAFSLVKLLQSEAGLAALGAMLGDVLRSISLWGPEWLVDVMPDQHAVFSQLGKVVQEHANALTHTGLAAFKSISYIIIGVIIGALIAINNVSKQNTGQIFTSAIQVEIGKFTDAFYRVVKAQFKISLLNTTLTAVFLCIILPIAGSPLPLTKTLIVITFVAGLIPILGNIISNTVIVLISIVVSYKMAALSLAYLILIHKIEYLLNAKMIGHSINAHAFEILLSLIIFEHFFGIAGLIVAPIFYAYIKEQLAELDRSYTKSHQPKPEF